MSRKKILIIYTGGTLGMKRSDNGYTSGKGYLQQMLSKIPDLQSPELPDYDIIEFDPLFDSSDIQINDWNEILQVIKQNYFNYYGFIIIHGTDTMAYTASALSFMIEGLDKNIIFTGSQIPLCEIRNDARENIITSLILCAEYSIHEVCIYFNGVLLRANRSYKSKVSGFNAFYSPNYPPIGSIGSKFNIKTGVGKAEFKFKIAEDKHEENNSCVFREITVNPEEIALLKIYPGISKMFLDSIRSLNLKGLVVEAYGAGNVPSNEKQKYVKETLAELVDRGCLVVVCTQCTKGSVHPGEYVTSLKSVGAISAVDMTTEACLAKLYYVLSLDSSLKEQKQIFSSNLRGEIS